MIDNTQLNQTALNATQRMSEFNANNAGVSTNSIVGGAILIASALLLGKAIYNGMSSSNAIPNPARPNPPGIRLDNATNQAGGDPPGLTFDDGDDVFHDAQETLSGDPPGRVGNAGATNAGAGNAAAPGNAVAGAGNAPVNNRAAGNSLRNCMRQIGRAFLNAFRACLPTRTAPVARAVNPATQTAIDTAKQAAESIRGDMAVLNDAAVVGNIRQQLDDAARTVADIKQQHPLAVVDTENALQAAYDSIAEIEAMSTQADANVAQLDRQVATFATSRGSRPALQHYEAQMVTTSNECIALRDQQRAAMPEIARLTEHALNLVNILSGYY